MGLTIKGQCIPDVAEPMGCVQRAEGFSERGARAVAAAEVVQSRKRRGSTAGGGGGRPSSSRSPTPPGRLETGFGVPECPDSQGDIWSSEPPSLRRGHLPQGGLTCRCLAGKEDGRRWHVPWHWKNWQEFPCREKTDECVCSRGDNYKQTLGRECGRAGVGVGAGASFDRSSSVVILSSPDRLAGTASPSLEFRSTEYPPSPPPASSRAWSRVAAPSEVSLQTSRADGSVFLT
ncbi:uncharacterized protein [Chlorocebus sabaeus]|uniref:uncharacterized protein n=1 Tax=Chlorocebus sabaeus TaxID=60711 RepID=UPI003BF99A48